MPTELIEQHFGFTVPEKMGLCTMDACEGILSGQVRGFVGLGSNFLRAIPDTLRMEPAWQGLHLNVQVATKLNRTHLLPARHQWLLPCLGRIEIDRQNGVAQTYTTEDSTGCIHSWRGSSEPVGPHVRAEASIVAGLAMASNSISAP